MSIVPCFCSAPLLVIYRLKSPGFTYFAPYISSFQEYMTSGLNLYRYQLQIDSFSWQKGPRLRMYLKIFPVDENNSHLFNNTEVRRIRSKFTGWTIPDSDVFGPYELLKFTLLDPYKDGIYSLKFDFFDEITSFFFLLYYIPLIFNPMLASNTVGIS